MEEKHELVGVMIKKKEELVRIITQSLYSLGFPKSAASLESESGVPLKSSQLASIETLIKESRNLEECVASPLLPEEALFVVCRQWVSECGVSALSKIWRSAANTDQVLHRLALDLLLSPTCAANKSRVDLFRDVEKVLPAPVTLPEGRLLGLVEMAVESQLESCVYHNSPHQHLSLFHDHRCPRHLFPTHTIQVLTDHQNEVWFVQFSNNGQYLASSSSDCTAIIWKVLKDCKLTMKHMLQSHQKPVSFVAWSPDDTMLLTCGNIEVLKLWDVETGACKYTFGNLGFSISSCAWFPDSKRFVCGSSDAEKGIHMWDCEGNELKAWRGSRMPKILDLAVTPDGENLISIFSDKDIRILNLATNGERVISEEHPITSLSVSKDSKFLLVNLNSQEIHMWDVSGKWAKPLKYRGHKQHKYVIRSCFGGLNSTFIASGSENSQVYIWNRRSPNPIEVLSGHKMTVNCVSWNPERPQMLASASDDHTIRIWGPSRSDCTRKQET